MNKVDAIPTSEIESDIRDTEKEIEQLEKELSALRENPAENKLPIYMREGNILKRKDFINKLKGILESRKLNPLSYTIE